MYIVGWTETKFTWKTDHAHKRTPKANPLQDPSCSRGPIHLRSNQHRGAGKPTRHHSPWNGNGKARSKLEVVSPTAVPDEEELDEVVVIRPSPRRRRSHLVAPLHTLLLLLPLLHSPPGAPPPPIPDLQRTEKKKQTPWEWQHDGGGGSRAGGGRIGARTGRRGGGSRGGGGGGADLENGEEGVGFFFSLLFSLRFFSLLVDSSPAAWASERLISACKIRAGFCNLFGFFMGSGSVGQGQVTRLRWSLSFFGFSRGARPPTGEAFAGTGWWASCGVGPNCLLMEDGYARGGSTKLQNAWFPSDWLIGSRGRQQKRSHSSNTSSVGDN